MWGKYYFYLNNCLYEGGISMDKFCCSQGYKLEFNPILVLHSLG